MYLVSDTMEVFCATCDDVQEVEPVEGNPDFVTCLGCGDEFAPPKSSEDDKYAHYKVGRVVKVDAVPKSKDLKLCLVDVVGDGNEESYLPIVTNAKYCEAGWKVNVLTIYLKRI